MNCWNGHPVRRIHRGDWWGEVLGSFLRKKDRQADSAAAQGLLFILSTRLGGALQLVSLRLAIITGSYLHLQLQFNLQLSDKERMDREKVVLPFEHQGTALHPLTHPPLFVTIFNNYVYFPKSHPMISSWMHLDGLFILFLLLPSIMQFKAFQKKSVMQSAVSSGPYWEPKSK